MISEFDPDVTHRAAVGADAPYDQRTCQNYPWAAAARIRHLEGLENRMVERVARAMWTVRRDKALRAGIQLEAWDDGSVPKANHILDEARAAITAMFEDPK